MSARVISGYRASSMDSSVSIGLSDAATTVASSALTSERSARTKEKRATEQKRVRELERELRRKDKALAEAAALLVLQKKVQAIWGDGDDDTPPKSDE